MALSCSYKRGLTVIVYVDTLCAVKQLLVKSGDLYSMCTDLFLIVVLKMSLKSAVILVVLGLLHTHSGMRRVYT